MKKCECMFVSIYCKLDIDRVWYMTLNMIIISVLLLFLFLVVACLTLFLAFSTFCPLTCFFSLSKNPNTQTSSFIFITPFISLFLSSIHFNFYNKYIFHCLIYLYIHIYIDLFLFKTLATFISLSFIYLYLLFQT